MIRVICKTICRRQSCQQEAFKSGCSGWLTRNYCSTRPSTLQQADSSGWSRIFAKILLYQILHFATSSGVSYSCKMWLTQLNIQLGHPTVNHSIVMVIFWIGVSIWVMLKERKIMVMSFIDNNKIFACRQCTTNMYVWIQVRQLLTSLGTAVQRAAAVSILN